MATLDTLQTAMAASVPRMRAGAQPLPAPGAQPLAPPTTPVTWPQPPVPQGAVPQQTVPAQPAVVPTTTTAPTFLQPSNEAGLVGSYLNQFLGADSALMRNARTTGLEMAASRGLANSSIAAGNAQRAALDAALPLVSEAMGTFNQRENRQWQTGERLGQQGWTSGENLLDRQQQTNERRETQEWTSTENRLDRDQQVSMVQLQDWLNNQSFMREFNANLATFPVQNATQLLNTIMQQALENPQVYTPDIISGMSEFFTTNFLDVLSRYFPNLYATQGG